MIEALGGNSKKIVRSYIERVERLRGERAAINADISEVFKEAKGEGFNTKALRRVIVERARAARMSEEDFQQEENDIDLYMNSMS